MQADCLNYVIHHRIIANPKQNANHGQSVNFELPVRLEPFMNNITFIVPVGDIQQYLDFGDGFVASILDSR